MGFDMWSTHKITSPETRQSVALGTGVFRNLTSSSSFPDTHILKIW